MKDTDEYPLETVEIDSKYRCQATGPKGQCRYKVLEGKQYCAIHTSYKDSAKREELRNYRIDKYRARLGEMLCNTKFKDLSEEVALLRILVEERFNIIKVPGDLILHGGFISDTIGKITKTITSLHNIETSLKLHLDKTQAVQFAQEIGTVIAGVVADEESLAKIANGIEQILARYVNSARPNIPQP